MRRPLVLAAVIVVLLAALAVAAWLRQWGLFALLSMLAAGATWYRLQVRRTQADESLYDGMGEETRMTSMQQGGSPSELAAEDAREGARAAASPEADPVDGADPR